MNLKGVLIYEHSITVMRLEMIKCRAVFCYVEIVIQALHYRKLQTFYSNILKLSQNIFGVTHVTLRVPSFVTPWYDCRWQYAL